MLILLHEANRSNVSFSSLNQVSLNDRAKTKTYSVVAIKTAAPNESYKFVNSYIYFSVDALKRCCLFVM